MRIGQAAKQAGIPTKTIRYYESIGLLPAPERGENGYRRYSEREIEILRFVQRARKLGFSIKDVEDLLALWSDRDRASADVRALAEAHIAQVEDRIEKLQSIRNTLVELVHRCHGDDRPDCPILDTLAGSEKEKAP